MNEIKQVIEEKFTRCPECRSFSVQQSDDLTQKEKFKRFFVPVSVQVCSNCSYRIVITGKFSTRLKESFLPGRLWRKPLLVAAPVLVIVILIVLLAVAGGKGQEPAEPAGKTARQMHPLKEKPGKPGQQDVNIEKKEPAPAEKKPVPEQEEKGKQGISSPPPSPPVAPVVDIVLGNSNRFGVNWRPLGEGVQITRLSNGPLKRAGMLVSDWKLHETMSSMGNAARSLSKFAAIIKRCSLDSSKTNNPGFPINLLKPIEKPRITGNESQ
jgi:hypothetical protein